MAGIALNNYELQESTKSNHVTYTERYQSGTGGGGTDSEGNSLPTYPIYSEATWYSNAKITGKVIASNSNVYINGVRAVVQGDQTQESWVADPPPYAHNGGTIISISPGTSGSGQGTVGNGDGIAYSSSKKLASKGTTVTTHLGTQTTIKEGSTTTFV